MLIVCSTSSMLYHVIQDKIKQCIITLQHSLD